MLIPFTLTVLLASGAAQQHQHAAAGAEQLGTVRFTTSCTPAAQPSFLRALALLHSFEFGPAVDGFTAAASADPACGIAYWGIALSRWGNPFAAGNRPAPQLQAGRDAAAKALAAGAKTERERAFIAAAERLFKDFETVDQRARALAYRDAMAQVASQYPDDVEASAFYALALAASADPTDKSYASLKQAGAILERLAPAQPDHPGIVHYIIHAYDVPPLAPQALAAARKYAKVAPSAPHALHMPSHTFTRLGYWQDSIDTNIASAAAARREQSTNEELHATDYEVYAYLQLGQDAAAKRLVDGLPGVLEKVDPNRPQQSAAPGTAGAFARAAIPARYALERRSWADAARLEPVTTTFLHADAITWFARGLGAAHTNDLASARTSVEKLQDLQQRLAKAGEGYWAEQVEIQRLGVSAWIAFAEQRKDDALATMRTAAEREDATEKNAVTPGPIAPARELLGEMLLEVGKPAEALTAFETTLAKEPNRFRALAGATEAARRAKNTTATHKYAKALLTVAAAADASRPEIAAAKSSLR